MVVVPYSGGMESMALLAYAQTIGSMDAIPLVFNDNETETPNRRSAVIAGLIEMGFYNQTVFMDLPNNDLLQNAKGTIPGYKMMMCVAAMSYAHSRVENNAWILLGHTLENSEQPWEDQKPEFFTRLSDLWRVGYGSNIRIGNPFYGKYKHEVLSEYRTLPHHLSVSCDSLTLMGTDHCGTCEGCTHRSAAFRLAGIDDPTEYRHRPLP